MKKQSLIYLLLPFLLSCVSYREAPPYTATSSNYTMPVPEEDITHSLFTDKNASITEENIGKILDGQYSMPDKLRVAIINIDNQSLINRGYSWNDEDYLSSRQKYLSTIINNLESQQRVSKVSLIPDMMVPTAPTFITIREAAVRMQADIVLVYSVKAGMYSKFKMFKADEYKAFATTQIMIMDVRTGLIPFTTVITEDYLSTKVKDDFNANETEKRIQEEAVSKCLTKVCDDINVFFNK